MLLAGARTGALLVPGSSITKPGGGGGTAPCGRHEYETWRGWRNSRGTSVVETVGVAHRGFSHLRGRVRDVRGRLRLNSLIIPRPGRRDSSLKSRKHAGGATRVVANPGYVLARPRWEA
jgi:hypothetical protein